MKYFILICSIFTLTNCAEKKAGFKDVDIDSAMEISAEQRIVPQKGIIPVYDYKMLESQLLQNNNDTTYVVNFWATWCKPCIKELPYFEQLGKAYSNKKLKVVLVSLDFPENLETKVIPFAEKNKLLSDIILLDDTDANTWIPKVSESWEGSIPATLFFKGNTKKFYERSFTYEELENEVKSIL